ncbi:MAG: hypothetical protein PGN34_17430 [Methylobacterium frigidaeris]
MADLPAPSAPDRRHDRLVSLGVAALVLGTVLVSHLAPGARHAALGPDQDPACLEWTDSCVVCVRGADGAHCSLPGIACTREAPRCTRRQ